MEEENSQKETQEIHEDIETLKLALQAAGKEYDGAEESDEDDQSCLRVEENWDDPGEGNNPCLPRIAIIHSICKRPD